MVLTLNPIVGLVCVALPIDNFYKIDVLPAPSNPNINILTSFLPANLCHSLENIPPILNMPISKSFKKNHKGNNILLLPRLATIDIPYRLKT